MKFFDKFLALTMFLENGNNKYLTGFSVRLQDNNTNTPSTFHVEAM